MDAPSPAVFVGLWSGATVMTSRELCALAGIYAPGQSEPRVRSSIHVLQQPGVRQPTRRGIRIRGFVTVTFYTCRPPIVFVHWGGLVGSIQVGKWEEAFRIKLRIAQRLPVDACGWISYQQSINSCASTKKHCFGVCAKFIQELVHKAHYFKNQVCPCVHLVISVVMSTPENGQHP